MLILGAIIIVGTIFLLVRQYETRMVLFVSGVLMASLAGKPMAAFDAFAKNMTTSGLIEAICSVMGFALVMKVTECDKHLIHLIANVDVMQVIAVHSTADFVAVLIGAASITVVAHLLKEDKGYTPPESDAITVETPILKTNILYAIIPIIPVLLLVAGATGYIPAFKKLGVPQARRCHRF